MHQLMPTSAAINSVLPGFINCSDHYIEHVFLMMQYLPTRTIQQGTAQGNGHAFLQHMLQQAQA